VSHLFSLLMIKIKLLLIYQREGWLSCFKPSILHHHNGHYSALRKF